MYTFRFKSNKKLEKRFDNKSFFLSRHVNYFNWKLNNAICTSLQYAGGLFHIQTPIYNFIFECLLLKISYLPSRVLQSLYLDGI